MKKTLSQNLIDLNEQGEKLEARELANEYINFSLLNAKIERVEKQIAHLGELIYENRQKIDSIKLDELENLKFELIEKKEMIFKIWSICKNTHNGFFYFLNDLNDLFEFNNDELSEIITDLKNY
jgi:hypothetical protein